MNKRFTYELIIGIICLISVTLFGDVGMVAFALFAVYPFIGKKKADERESQLFNKVGNVTAGLTLIASVVIYLASDIVLSGHRIGEFWLGFVAASFLIAHGASGLIILKKG